VANNSAILFQADQVFFNSDVLLAARAGRFAREESSLQTEYNEIDVVVEVSKAFYGLLLAQYQLLVAEEDIIRRKKLLDDSYNQYVAGVVDKVDYKRSGITYNNSLSARKRYTEELNYRGFLLKQLIGYPINDPLILQYDTLAMQRESNLDTNQVVDINKRVEYKLQNTQLQLLRLNVSYYKWGFLPQLSGFVNYNFYYQNEELSKLYSRNFPNSIFGFRAVVPLFQGTRRIQNLQKSKLQYERLQLDQDYFKEQVQTEYSLALGAYKSNLFELKMQKENLANAKEVYSLVKFQYDEGIKTYLDVTTAEVELRTTEIAYLNSLYNVLVSKLDVEKALGIVSW
jgi:outer membrane protein TolC